MTLLLVKVQWMPSYTGETDVKEPWGEWVKTNNPPEERFNFLRQSDGSFYGYLRPPGRGEQVDIGRLGGASDASSVDRVTVIFVAPQPRVEPSALTVVGYYREATVHRTAVAEANIRLIAKHAVSIPEELRTFSITLDTPWGSGLYRFVEGDAESNILKWLDSFAHTDEAVEESALSYVKVKSAEEWRVLHAASRLERRSSINWRREILISDANYACACCDFSLSAGSPEAMKSMFEVHHLAPISMLKDGEIRQSTAGDFAVVCANCHRAIHGTRDMKYIQNMDAFRKDILGREPREP